MEDFVFSFVFGLGSLTSFLVLCLVLPAREWLVWLSV